MAPRRMKIGTYVCTPGTKEQVNAYRIPKMKKTVKKSTKKAGSRKSRR